MYLKSKNKRSKGVTSERALKPPSVILTQSINHPLVICVTRHCRKSTDVLHSPGIKPSILRSTLRQSTTMVQILGKMLYIYCNDFYLYNGFVNKQECLIVIDLHVKYCIFHYTIRYTIMTERYVAI